MKLKAVLALTATLTLGVAAAQGTTTTTAAQAPALTDVPAGHWAKDAVDRLVSQGIILGFPDGTFRGTQNLTRYQAAVIIARVLDLIATNQVTVTTPGQTPTPGQSIDPATVTALQNAVQELAADLAALGVRVADLEENSATKDDIARIEDRLNNLVVPGGNDQAITDLQGTIADLSARVDELSGNYDALRADVDDNASSIAALNDLTVLLNQDILSLQDRVSALETGKADRSDVDALSGRLDQTNGRVDQIDTRVKTLEDRPVLSLTGGLSSTTGSINITSSDAAFDASNAANGGTGFDIDRLTAGTFLGDSLSDNDPSTGDASGDLGASGFTFGLGVTNIKTANGQFVLNQVGINFGVRNLFSFAPEGTVTGGTGNTTTTGDTNLYLKSVAATGSVGGNPFTVGYQAYQSQFTFNQYMFDNTESSDYTRRGVTANIMLNSLPFAPSLTLVAGNGFLASADSVGQGARNAVGPYFGVRVAVNPFGIGSLGLSYAQGYGADPGGTSGYRNVFGADLKTNIGPVAVNGVYVRSLAAPLPFSEGDQAIYVTGAATFGFVNAVANFRAISPAFALGRAGLSQDGLNDGNNTAPFVANQYGFGGGASLNLGFLTANGYGDLRSNYYNNYFGNAFSGTNFGGSAGLNNTIFGFGAKVFFNSSRGNDGFTYDQAPFSTNNGYDNYSASTSATATYQGTIPAPYRFTSTFGVVVSHDGTQPTALVPNLNLTFGYANFYNSGANDFQAYGDYTGTFGAFTLKPFARYHYNGGGLVRIAANNGASVSPSTLYPSPVPTNADGTTNALPYSTFKVGAQLTTAPFTGIFFSPSLDTGVSYRTTAFQDAVGTNTTEFYGRAGVLFNDFLTTGVTFGVGYSYYQAQNVNSMLIGSSYQNFTTTQDRLLSSPPSNTPFQTAAGTHGGTLNGFYAQANFYGVKASYGLFSLDSDQGAATGQGFKLGYEVKF